MPTLTRMEYKRLREAYAEMHQKLGAVSRRTLLILFGTSILVATPLTILSIVLDFSLVERIFITVVNGAVVLLVDRYLDKYRDAKIKGIVADLERRFDVKSRM